MPRQPIHCTLCDNSRLHNCAEAANSSARSGTPHSAVTSCSSATSDARRCIAHRLYALTAPSGVNRRMMALPIERVMVRHRYR